MRTKILSLAIVMGVFLTAAIGYSVESNVQLTVQEGESVIVPVNYTELPFVIPTDGTPMIVPIDENRLSVVPFDGDRPKLYEYAIVAEIPYKVQSVGGVMIRAVNGNGVILAQLEDKTLVIKIWDEMILPHAQELIGIFENYTGDVIMNQSVLVPNPGLANEPIIVTPAEKKVLISLQGGGGGIYIKGGTDPMLIFDNGIRVIDSTVVSIVDGNVQLFGISDTGLTTLEGLTGGIQDFSMISGELSY